MAAPVVPTMLAMTVPNARMGGIDRRRAAQAAGYQDAARHHVKRHQQDDEAQVFAEHFVK